MKKTNLAISLLVASATFLSASSPIFAEQTQSARQGQTYEVECEVYADGYGESSSNCYVTGAQYQELQQSQDQEDRVVYIQTAAEKEVVEHVPVDTALDLKSTVAAASTMLSGLAAFVVKMKSRV
jgi:hypothetical protein